MRFLFPRFSRSFLLYVLTLAVVSIFSVLFYTFIARASVYNLYATTCLGGWENTHLAAGAPEANDGGEAPVFTETNSAKLRAGTLAQMYCGGFTGDILENTVPKKILVKFSWAIEYPELKIVEIPTAEADSATSTEEVTEEETAESHPDTEATLPSEETVVEEVKIPTEESSVPEVPEVTPTMSERENNPPAEIPAEIPVEIPTPTDEPVSFFNFLSPVAHAQEADTNESTELEATTTDTTSDEIATTTPNETYTSETPYGLVEVMYTLDGVKWKSLGFVGKDEFAGKQFEIPIEEVSKWEDVSKIQIGVESMSVLDSVAPTIYLDSVWIETEYEFLQGQGQEQSAVSQVASVVGGFFNTEETITFSRTSSETFENSPEEGAEERLSEEEGVIGESDVVAPPETSPPSFLKHEFKKEIILDSEAKHYCKATPFSIDVSGWRSLSTELDIVGSFDKKYELEIGALPDGIDVRFTKNDDYIYHPESDDDTLSLIIRNEEGSRSGNFTIPVVFTEKGKKPSSVICQINIINQ